MDGYGERPEIITQFLRHLTLQGLSAHTLRHYGGTPTHPHAWLSDQGIGLADATLEILTCWREQLTVADSSIAAYIAGVRSFYGWADRQQLVPFNPAAYIPVPRVGRRMPRPIRDDDLEYAIDAAQP